MAQTSHIRRDALLRANRGGDAFQTALWHAGTCGLALPKAGRFAAAAAAFALEDDTLCPADVTAERIARRAGLP